MKDVLRLLSYIKPYWHFQGFYILCQLVYFGGFIVLPWIEKILIDDVFLAKDADKLLSTCGLWMLVAFGMYLFTLGFAYFPIKVSQNAAKDIQLAAYHHLRRLGFKFYDTQQTGKVMALFTSDTPKAIEGFQIFASDYPTNIILLIITIPVVMSVSWQLCLLSLLLVGVTVSIPTLLNKSLNRIGEEVQEQNAVLSSNLQESIAGSRELKGLGKELYDLKNIHHFLKQLVTIRIKQVKLQKVGDILVIWWLSDALVLLVGWGILRPISETVRRNASRQLSH